jgi:putative ABC transport system permease protein
VTDLLASAWLNITRHRLRSLLAMAGVAVGVCALTSIMSVEQAWRKAVTDFFEPMDLETVRVAIPAGDNWRELGFRRPSLEPSDVKAVLDEGRSVQSATLMTWGTLRAEADDGSALELAVRAVHADFTKTLPDELKEGRLFTAEEEQRHAAVCLLSYEARVWLFGSEGTVVGRHVRLGGQRFAIAGVVAGNRHAGIGSRAVYVPATWSRTLIEATFGPVPWTEIFVRVRDPKAASVSIERLMRQRLGGDSSRPYTHSLWEVREAALNARNRATLYSGLAGLCALVAAGIGIAALLFVSVAERAREIGIHRALGATKLRIYGEYLLAAAMLSLGGAAIGAVLGIPAAAAGAFTSRWQPVLDPLAGEMLTESVPGLSKIAVVAPSIAWGALLTASAIALLTGITAALAPASEAAAVLPATAIAQRPGTRGGARRALTSLQVAFGVLVLVVLTSYFSVLESEERAEARNLLGQDKVSAIADPIAAMRKPVDSRYIARCKDALVTATGTPEALAQLRKRTPLLTDLVPVAPLRLGVAHGGTTADDIDVIFTSGGEFHYRPELAGEWLRRATEAFDAGRAAAVLNPDAREELFGGRDPIGQTITVAGKQFTVVAIRPNPPGMQGMRQAYVPIAFYAALRPRAVRTDVFAFASEARVDARPIDPRRYVEALAQLRDAVLPLLPPEYRKGIKLSEDIPETTKQFIFQHKAVAIRGAVGALAVLLVALIGLANMLLVSVHEELREVGVRRAFGALRGDIFWHFLSQGVLLSGLGAGAGLGLGALICWATRNWSGTPLAVSAFWAAAGAVATLLAGTFTSAVPALIGARVAPIEALRYE